MGEAMTTGGDRSVTAPGMYHWSRVILTLQIRCVGDRKVDGLPAALVDDKSSAFSSEDQTISVGDVAFPLNDDFALCTDFWYKLMYPS